VELALRKFFRVVRSAKSSALVDMKVTTPCRLAGELGKGTGEGVTNV
jgi:hypothetical protein